MTGFKGTIDHDTVLAGLTDGSPLWLDRNAPAIKLHIEQLAADNARLREKTRDAIARREVGLKALKQIATGTMQEGGSIYSIAMDAIAKIEYHE